MEIRKGTRATEEEIQMLKEQFEKIFGSYKHSFDQLIYGTLDKILDPKMTDEDVWSLWRSAWTLLKVVSSEHNLKKENMPFTLQKLPLLGSDSSFNSEKEIIEYLSTAVQEEIDKHRCKICGGISEEDFHTWEDSFTDKKFLDKLDTDFEDYIIPTAIINEGRDKVIQDFWITYVCTFNCEEY